ncbi:UPF0382 membrane protein [Neolecta irregularis DAH-3]|uniref:UPF0382 membrane protein n=1 Tax=Neolecta irregularis (strain DAH-3) TaxID=1198029 RepID=A0A1U7LIZ3_NEOID|nr:UPF0382 membrane protein [Neolecta irregularis DAH-3]|eukprot:OLL22563.1 UPF0382 membrane protein [Neolecta irregularis DAH-3]
MLSSTAFKIGAAYGCVPCFIGVASGAFGAHGLQKRITDQNIIKTDCPYKAFVTGSQYMLLHGITIVALSAHPRFGKSAATIGLFSIGTALFSGSIFALTTLPQFKKVLGPITPIGGLLILGGWASLLV